MRRVPFWLLVLLSLVGYALLAIWFPLDPDFHRFPVPDIRTFTPSLREGLAYGALLSALFGLYGLAYRRVLGGTARLSLGVILLAAAILCLPLLFTFPFNATDIYGYYIRGRVMTVYRENPYSVPANAFPDDPYFALIGAWAAETTPQGPLWVLASAGVALLSGDNLQVALYLFKTLAALLHLAVGGLIWLAQEDVPRDQRAARTLLWAWNPALLLIFVADGHNDGGMLFWLLLGAWLIRRGRSWGLVVMALGPLTKLVGLLPLPFFYLAVLRTSRGLAEGGGTVGAAGPRRGRLLGRWGGVRLVATCGLASLAVAVLSFLPFGSALKLGQRLVREATGAGGFSPVDLLILAARRLGLAVAARNVVLASSVLFALFALWLLWRTARGRSPVRAAADIMCAYLVQAFAFRIWYASWPFAWILSDKEAGPARLTGGLFFLFTTQLSVLIYGHLWTYCLAYDRLLSHLIGVPFVFLLPAAVALARLRSGDTTGSRA